MGTTDDEQLLQTTDEGVFGLAAVVRDFDDADLAKLRRLAEAVRTPDDAGLRAAIALAGSAAQSEFQLFPADCDFFERVHISAPTRDAALERLASSMIATVARLFVHPELQFVEMKLGLHGGNPISWTLADVDARSVTVPLPDGNERALGLLEAAQDPGFVKLDWVFADAEADRVVPVSKVIDATWETPDGSVVALDGVVDSFYQEVYLDPDSRPHVERLIDQVRPDGLEAYVAQLEGEIAKYRAPGHENYGKVAKRLYNIFRVTNRPGPAAHVRGLFDDPPARLYTVTSATHGLRQTLGRQRLDPEVVESQVRQLQEIFASCYVGDDCDELVALAGSLPTLDEAERDAAMDRLDDAAAHQVSAYFNDALSRHPEVGDYLDALAAR